MSWLAVRFLAQGRCPKDPFDVGTAYDLIAFRVMVMDTVDGRYFTEYGSEPDDNLSNSVYLCSVVKGDCWRLRRKRAP